MDTLEDAYEALRVAERTLRHLAQEALTAQRYQDVADVAKLADGVSGLLRGATSSLSASDQVRASPKPRKRRAAPQGGYPRYVRDGDRLVKVGWSKKKGREYEHRAPRDLAMRVASHLLMRTTADELFTTEDILPVIDPNSGHEIPAYQVYLVLGWLRASELIERHGRDGYRHPARELSEDELERIWDSLPGKGSSAK